MVGSIIKPRSVAPVGMLLFVGLTVWVQAQLSVTPVELCVDSTSFQFTVDIAGADSEVIFRIGADDPLFTANNERFAVNFDHITGAITRQSPEVQTFGTPVNDRWVDGAVSGFNLTAQGVGAWRIEGQIQHGPDAFQPGDTVNQILLRVGEFPDEVVSAVPIGACASIVLGDGNGDGVIDAADLVAILLEINDGDGGDVANVSGGSYPGTGALDVNRDENVNLDDVRALVELVFQVAP